MQQYNMASALTFLANQTEMPNVATIGKKMLAFHDNPWVKRSVTLAYDLYQHGFRHDILLSVILLHQVSINSVFDPGKLKVDMEIQIAVTRLLEQDIYGTGSLDTKYIKQNHLACIAYIADKYAVMELDQTEYGHTWRKSYIPNLKNSVQEMAKYLNAWLPEYKAMVEYMVAHINEKRCEDA